MDNGRDIGVVIQAVDEFSNVMNRFNTSAKDAASAMDTATASGGRLNSSWGNLINTAAGVAAGFGAVVTIQEAARWLIGAAEASLDAEKSFNRLRIQVEGLGYNYAAMKPVIDANIEATSRYAIVQDEDVAKTLQQLIFTSGDLSGSMKNLNLTYDLASQKGIDVSMAAELVGKSMTGNIDGLARLFPELHNVADELNKYATAEERTTYMQDLFTQKVNKASEAMTEHEKRLKNVKKVYDDIYQGVGHALVYLIDDQIKSFSNGLKAILPKDSDIYASIYGTAVDGQTAVADATKKSTEAAAFEQAQILATAKAREEYKKSLDATEKSLKAWVDMQTPLQEELTRLNDEIKKATMSMDEYMAAYALEQIQMGKDLTLLNELIKAKQKKLEVDAADKEAKSYAEAEKKILDVNAALAQQSANQEELYALKGQELLATGATVDQYWRYLDALRAVDAQKTVMAANDARQRMYENAGANNPLETKSDNEFAKATQSYQSSMANLQGFQETAQIQMAALWEKGFITEAEWQDGLTSLSEEGARKRHEFQATYAGETFGVMSDMMQNLYTLSGSKNKEMFALMKTFAVAQATIKGYQSAVNSYEVGSAIGGPPLGAAFAAVAIAATAAQIQKIVSTSPGSSTSISDSGTASTSYSGGAYDTTALTPTTANTATPTQSISINIYNPLDGNIADSTAQAIIDAINGQVGMNYTIDARVVSA